MPKNLPRISGSQILNKARNKLNTLFYLQKKKRKEYIQIAIKLFKSHMRKMHELFTASEFGRKLNLQNYVCLKWHLYLDLCLKSFKFVETQTCYYKPLFSCNLREMDSKQLFIGNRV